MASKKVNNGALLDTWRDLRCSISGSNGGETTKDQHQRGQDGVIVVEPVHGIVLTPVVMGCKK